MRRLVFWLALIAIQLGARPGHAHPWLIRHGLAECGGCHVDPMGGETLTGMGRVMGESLLAQPWSAAPPTDRAKLAFGISEPDAVRLGGSFRGMAIANLTTDRTEVFPMQADVYGAAFLERFTFAASVGFGRASARYEHASKARLIGDIEGEGIALLSRHHWVGYSPSDGIMLRAGRLNLPFGLRIPEHTAWVRSETLTDRESDQLHGLSFVYARGPLRGELMLSLGNFQVGDAAFQQRGYSAYVELLVARRLAVGASSLLMYAPRELEVDHGAVSRQAHGLTARYSPWKPIVLLVEADVLKNTAAGLGYVGMATLDVEPLQGLHLAVAREYLDRGEPDTGVASEGDGRVRVGTWWTINWFFAPHLDARIDLVQRELRADMVQAQLHLYL